MSSHHDQGEHYEPHDGRASHDGIGGDGQIDDDCYGDGLINNEKLLNELAESSTQNAWMGIETRTT